MYHRSRREKNNYLSLILQNITQYDDTQTICNNPQHLHICFLFWSFSPFFLQTLKHKPGLIIISINYTRLLWYTNTICELLHQWSSINWNWEKQWAGNREKREKHELPLGCATHSHSKPQHYRCRLKFSALKMCFCVPDDHALSCWWTKRS